MLSFSFVFATSLLLLPSALAFPQGDDNHDFKAPGDGDVRSPCPGLNTLANHGYLPRDGKNITIPIVLDAAREGFNVQPEALVLAARISLLTSTYAYDAFSLEDVRLHGTIEHDASLSRMDEALGSNWQFNEDIFSTLANSNPGVDYYNITSAAEVQHLRLEQSLRDNNETHNTFNELTMRSGESALYLSVMGNVTAGEAPKEFVNILFREERLPREEGWQRSPIPITIERLGALQQKVSEASDWPGPIEGQCAWVRTSPRDDLDIVGII
ncbi:Cloroperoxidase [Cylindrobasidium torrendii FP15055 ss-10]|uniref:Cloroperoxidase n=1 Tax=Cylindrobasidium torrendii FP15055 ss-10 TaxID=1314674 RepID=A0A0D7B8F5_9AGAR|nr:Cloroperoxidase [Cylindrobasidium torrendii FP15055 ss-10]